MVKKRKKLEEKKLEGKINKNPKKKEKYTKN